MKVFTTCALGAALAVPAIVQAQADFDATGLAQKYLMQYISSQKAVAKLATGVLEGKTAADEAAKKINAVSDIFEKAKKAVDGGTPAVKGAIERMGMINPKINKDKASSTSLAKEALEQLKAKDYAGNAELKAACEKFSALFNY